LLIDNLITNAMKKKINLDALKVKSFVTDVQNEDNLKGGFVSNTPYY